MKKHLGVAVGLLSIAVFMAGSAVAANPACNGADIYCADTNDGNAGSGNPLVAITSALPAQGILAFGYGASTDPTSYWLFYDGDQGTADPFDGYLGISGADLDRVVLGLVGNADGNFKRAGNNTELLTLLGLSLGTPPKLTALPGMGIPAAVPGLPFNPSGVVIPIPGLQEALVALPDQGRVLAATLPPLPTVPALPSITPQSLPSGFPNLAGLFPRR
jgi:hypothetical protein